MKKILITLIIIISAVTAWAFIQPRGQYYYPYQFTDVCSTDAAYAAGYYDGRYGRSPVDNYAYLCDLPPGPHNALNQAYLSGYRLGKKPQVIKHKQCIKTPNQGYICGYDCKKNSLGDGGCAPFPTQQCLVDRYTKKIICGYYCLFDKAGNAKCGRSYLDNCVKNQYGEVKCGENCRLSYGKIKCDSGFTY